MAYERHDGQIDWEAAEEAARNRTWRENAERLAGIARDLPEIDAFDRGMGTDRGGMYRDEASIIRKVMRGE